MLVRLIALCVLTTTLASANVNAAERIALLIGNEDYKPGVGKLANPLNDIELVGNALRKVGFEVLKPVKNATRADMLEALDNYAARLKGAGSDAIGFVYYSGHGIASRGKNYLIPVDVMQPSTKLLRANGVKQSEVLDILRQEAPLAAHYLVIDACRNELQGARGAKGFVAVNQQAGTLIAFATSPGKTASDVGKDGGPYAKALAAEIVKPGVTDLQMFSNVRFSVSSASGGDQVPWTLDGIVRRDRVMLGGPSKARPQVSPSAAARNWKFVKDTKDPSALRAFAKRYKGTVFADMALAMIAQPDSGRPKLAGLADDQKGKREFRVCAPCHSSTRGGRHRAGPNLWGIVGRPIASLPGFRYTSALKKKDQRWTLDNLERYIRSPKDWAPGTSMAFAGIKDPGRLGNLLAYLSGLRDAPKQQAQLRRGLQVYREVCAACHDLSGVRFVDLTDENGPQMSAGAATKLAGEYEISANGTTRPGTLDDFFPRGFANEKDAADANNGFAPPDLSRVGRMRGSEYVRSILLGYREKRPKDLLLPDGASYNAAKSDRIIQMPNPLIDMAVEYPEGTKATVEQMAADVARFIDWASKKSAR